ncbi:MAG: FKBP-type peptidyl-prolyl cis-trans isomerase [Rickettsiales bacterium]
MGWLFPGGSGGQTKWVRVAALVIIGAFCYDQYTKNLSNDVQGDEEKSAPGEESKVEKETNSWLESSVKRYADTESGREVLKALMRGRLKDETGADDPALALTQLQGTQARFYDIKIGGGNETFLQCGDEMKVHWRLIDKHNAEILDTRRQGAEPEFLRLGAHNLVPGVEHSLFGMRPGGVRRVQVPSKLAFDGTGFFNSYVMPKDPVAFEVEVTEIKPAPVLNVRVIGEETVPHENDDALTLECGMEAEIDVSASGRGGAPQSLRFTFGRETPDAPLFAQRMAQGLRAQESRTAEAPNSPEATEALRRLFGDAQEEWFKDGFVSLRVTLRTLR